MSYKSRLEAFRIVCGASTLPAPDAPALWSPTQGGTWDQHLMQQALSILGDRPRRNRPQERRLAADFARACFLGYRLLPQTINLLSAALSEG